MEILSFSKRKISLMMLNMYSKFLSLIFCCLLLSYIESKTSSSISEACKKINHHQNRHAVLSNVSIGVVIDEKSRMGREQRIAMELAVRDLRHCLNLKLHVRDSNGSSTRAASAAIDLAMLFKVEAIIGKITRQEAAIFSELETINRTIPVVSLYPTTSAPKRISQNLPHFIETGTPIQYQIQCITAIFEHFKWKKAIIIHEQGNSYTEDFNLISHFSDSLRAVNSSIDHHLVFPRLSSLLNPDEFVEQELKKLKGKNVRVFVVTQSSLEFATVLFQKSKDLEMMGKGYAWIVSDEIGNFLDSTDLSVKYSMQGVIGLKTHYQGTREIFTEFKSMFRRKYGSEYPEEENLNPSVYASHAYDAIQILAEALLLGSKEEIDFKSLYNGSLSQNPVFQIINVIGTGYKEIAFWSPKFGFSQHIDEYNRMKTKSNDCLSENLSLITWPGGDQIVPEGLTMGSKENPLKIGVPAKGAFPWFVKVTHDLYQNRIVIKGFSIAVFEAAVKQLPYELHYVFIPYNGTYDEMVLEVYKHSLDAAVGDTEIMANRSAYVEFTQPYVDSGLAMVVTAKPRVEESKWFPLNIFTKKLWIQLVALNILTGAIIWLSEYAVQNEEFTKIPLSKLIGSVLWLSITILSFSQREHIKSNTSKFVMATWTRIIFIVGASFTAVLSTMMTVPRLQPSVSNVDYIRNANLPVGCNANSFICEYLVNALHLKRENIRGINSIDDYPKAFQSGAIKAAFFVEPHAKVFLAQDCKSYTKTEEFFKLGGFGFVFPKGSTLAFDFSEAILKITQSGQVDNLQKKMLSSNCTSSTVGDYILDSGPFSLMFIALVCVFVISCFIAIYQLAKRRCTSMVLLIELYRRFNFRLLFRERIVVRGHRINVKDEENLQNIQLAPPSS